MKNFIAAVAIFLITAGVAIADHHEAREMSAEEKAMMETMQKNATPGNHHAKLAASAGTYKAVMKSWGAPGTAPAVSEMSVKRNMQLGGRVLEEHWSGSFMGAPFEGVSRTGYDNQKQRYWTTWSDNMSTGLFIAYGNWDDSTGALVFTGDAVDPMTGEVVPTRSVVRYLDDDTETMDMYQSYGGGEEFKSMAFRMTRTGSNRQ